MSLVGEPVTTAASVATRLSPDNPWPGLTAFSEQDRAYFHGRETETAELTRLVRREPLTVLFGRSGLGKTSLLGAGLFPRLREDGYLPVSIRLSYAASAALSAQVREALLAACAAAEVEAPPPLPGGTLWEFFQRSGTAFWNARNRPLTPVLVLDQFEEIFTLGQEDEVARRRSAEFLEELGDLIEHRPPAAVRRALDADPEAIAGFDFQRRACKIVLSFREDFLASMEGLKGRMPSLTRNRYRLQPMNGVQAHEVVARSGGRLVDESVTGQIIGLAWRNAADPPPDPADYPSMEIDPALLSVICSELNLKRQRAGRERITADLLAGAEREILTDFYERAFTGLDVRVREFVEDELITDRGFRDSFALEDALERPGMSRAAVDQLVAGRLLRVDERFGVRRLELTHDVLTRVVRESRDSRKAREAEAAAAAREAAARRLQWRNRVFLGLVAVGAVMVVAAGAYVYLLQREVRRQSKEVVVAQNAAAAANADAARLHDKAIEAQKAADVAGAAVVTATRQATDLAEQARATDLITNTRNVRSEFLDRALLLGATAIREYPERLEAQVYQLVRLLPNPQLRLLIRGRSFAFSGDGKVLAAGSYDGTITLWASGTWRQRRSWKGHKKPVRALAFSADGSRIVSADDTSVVMWRLPEGAEVRRASHASGRVAGLSLAPDGGSVALLHGSNVVTIWRTSGNPGSRPEVVVTPRRNRRGRVLCLAFSPDGKTLAVVDYDQVVKWDVGESRRLEGTTWRGTARSYSPDCGVVAVVNASAPGGSEVQAVDVWGKREPRTLRMNEAPRSLSLSPDGRRLAIALGRGYQVWDPATVNPRPGPSLGGAVQDMVFSPDGNTLAFALDSGTVIARDSRSDALTFSTTFSTRIPGRARARRSAANEDSDEPGEPPLRYSPDGQTLVVQPPPADFGDRITTVWSLRRGDVLTESGTPHQSQEMEFNWRGDILASVGADGAAVFWDASTRKVRSKVSLFTEAEFSLDGSKVAVANNDGTIDIRDASGKIREATLRPPGGRGVKSLAFSGNNRRLAVGFEDGSVAVYDLTAPARPMKEFKEHEGNAKVAFSPDGSWLASGGGNGRVVLWSVADGRTVALKGHRGAVLRMAFSPDGTLLASGSDDQTVGLHDVRSLQLAARFEPHDEAVTSVVFIDNGKALVSGGGVRGWREVWDVPGRRWLASLRTPGSVALSSQGRRIALRHEDDTITLRTWDAPTLVAEACRIVGRNLSCEEWRQFMGDKPYHKTCEALPSPEPCR